MKTYLKIIYIFVGLISILYMIKIYNNYSQLKEIKAFLGINSSEKIEILKKGGGKEPPRMFMVLKLKHKIPESLLQRDYKLKKNMHQLGCKYFNCHKSFYYKQEQPAAGSGILKRDVMVQGKMVFYEVTYTN